MKNMIYVMLLAVLLQSCTLTEALVGAGAAGTAGYLIGRENNPPERRYSHCDHYRHHTRCY